MQFGAAPGFFWAVLTEENPRKANKVGRLYTHVTQLIDIVRPNILLIQVRKIGIISE